MSYAIKTVPEDFYVREIIDLKISKISESGPFSYYILKKTNCSTIDAINLVSKKFNIQRKNINFAGTKDKKAITEQVISIKQGPKHDFDLGKVKLQFMGYGEEQLNLGDNSGNYFEIIVKDFDKRPVERGWFINYFDDQRFSENNSEIGKAIIKKEFEIAVNLVLKNSGSDYELSLAQYLQNNKNDFVGALRTIDRKILRMFIHSYQSYLWNETVSNLFDGQKISYSLGRLNVPPEKPDQKKVELSGFGSEETEMMKQEGVSSRDFIIREIPELSSEGSERDILVEVNDLKLEEISGAIKLSFSLPKGSYATMFIKHLFM